MRHISKFLFFATTALAASSLSSSLSSAHSLDSSSFVHLSYSATGTSSGAASTPSSGLQCLQSRSASNTVNSADLVDALNRIRDDACADKAIQQAQHGILAWTLFEGYNLSIILSGVSTSQLQDNCANAIVRIAKDCIAESEFLGGQYVTSEMTIKLLDQVYPRDPIFSAASSTSSSHSLLSSLLASASSSSTISSKASISPTTQGHSLASSSGSSSAVSTSTGSSLTVGITWVSGGTAYSTSSSLPSTSSLSSTYGPGSISSQSSHIGGITAPPVTTQIPIQASSSSHSSTPIASSAFAVISGSVHSANSSIAALKSSQNQQADAQRVKDLINDAKDAAALAGLAYLASLLGEASVAVEGFMAGTSGIEAVTAAWASTMAAEAELEQEEENEEQNDDNHSTEGDQSTKKPTSSNSSKASSSTSSSSLSSSSSSSVVQATQTMIYSIANPNPGTEVLKELFKSIWRNLPTDQQAYMGVKPTSTLSSSLHTSSTLTSTSRQSSSASIQSGSASVQLSSSGQLSSKASSSVLSKTSTSKVSTSIQAVPSFSKTSSSNQAVTSTSRTQSPSYRSSDKSSTVSSTLKTVVSTSSSQVSSSPTPTPSSATSTFTIPPPKTVTSNGMECVLPYGSNDPVCQPLETPTPNPAGTNVHVNEGCISINGSPRCASGSPYESSYNVASSPDQPYSTTWIYAKFNSSDPFSVDSTPGCELQARWPANYGDVYFGADGCLYDSQSNNIYNQCCTASSAASVENPYVIPEPAATCTKDNALLYIKFRIWSKDWVNGNPSKLKHEVSGCGAMTGWYQESNTDHKKDASVNKIGDYQADYYVSFNLPLTFATGCVGDAIHSAGGPKISC